MRSKHKTIIIIVVILLAMSAATSVSALDFGSGATQKAAKDAGYNPNTTETTFAETTGSIIAIILSFTGVIFLVLMVYAGWLWMTARGEEEPVEKAQKIIISSIIGFIILVGAYSITTFVVPRLTDVTGKDEGEETICCRICSKADLKAGTLKNCSYKATSQELCVNECASGQLGPEGNKCDTAELLGTSGVVCSAANWSPK
ncbi:MAG: hypothetical protein HY569_02670 [Candidatus Magasanikbacteria bacterium]|nr:hypothetical protein [Candidatus Magasanikbacteria bacterium]